MDLTQPVLLTAEGLEKLKQELEQARLRRIESADRMKEAAQAKEEVQRIDDRIYELNEMIGRAQIIRERHSSTVDAGSTIELEDDQGEKVVYHLVGAVEADPGAGRISLESPLGRALLGRKKGDRVSVAAPAGTLEMRILAVN